MIWNLKLDVAPGDRVRCKYNGEIHDFTVKSVDLYINNCDSIIAYVNLDTPDGIKTYPTTSVLILDR